MKGKLRSAIVTLAAAAVISSGMVTASASTTHVAAPATAVSSVQAAKTQNCGWGIKSKYHSCDFAYNLILSWLKLGSYPREIYSVFSPNSGKRYRLVKCSGAKTVTCRSDKGAVTFKPTQLPAKYMCGYLDQSKGVYAWLNSSCEFTVSALRAYQSGPANASTISVLDPTDGRTYKMICNAGDLYNAAMCMSGRRVVVFG